MNPILNLIGNLNFQHLQHRILLFRFDSKFVLPNQVKEYSTKDGLVLSVLLHLEIIDSTKGYKVLDGKGGTVCLMLPRQDALHNLPNPNKALVNINLKGERRLIRGGKRVVCLGCNEEFKPVYQTIGLTPGRSFKGLYEKWPEEGLHKNTKTTIENMMNVVNTKICK